MKKPGFTLIELLVVVLIIGILAATAVPQYQKSVEKSRAMTAASNVRALAEAQRRYFLETGSCSSSFDDFDITVSDKNFNYTIQTSTVCHIFAQRPGHNYQILYFMDWPAYPEYSNKLVCRVSKSASAADINICKLIGKDFQDYRYLPNNYSISIIE